MCVNTHMIYNRYIKEYLRVPCGKCPACQQLKATHRANRIRNNIRVGQIMLFVTLTYQNAYIPFIYLDDLLLGESSLRVYRQNRVRWSRKRKQDYSLKVYNDCQVLGDVPVEYPSFYRKFKYYTLTTNKHREYWQVEHDSHKVAVIWYPDVQNFIKRLRLNLKRKYDYEKKFSFFACAELGPKRQRPHFHLILFIDRCDEKIFRDAVSKSWSYDSFHRKKKGIEVGRDPATYLASYVNRGNSVSPFFAKNFSQKHSYSHGFGLEPYSFRLSSILEKAAAGDLRYSKQFKRKDGHIDIIDVPIPKYVIDRYFHKFKGFSSFAPDTLVKLLQCPAGFNRFREDLVLDNPLDGGIVHTLDFTFRDFFYNDEDFYPLITRLSNQYAYYQSVTGGSQLDFAIDYERVWRVYSLTVIRHQYDDVKDVRQYEQMYDNIDDYKRGYIRAPTLDSLGLEFAETDPNKFRQRVEETNNLIEMYRKLDKHRKVVNYAMVANGDNV